MMDNRYYTRGDLENGAIDTRYYTETEINALLSALDSDRVSINGAVTTRARLAIKGTDASSGNGPHIEQIGSADDYPMMQLLAYVHDNVAVNFDTYWNGSSWIASDATGAQVYKLNDTLKVRRHSGSTPGSTATLSEVVSIDLATGATTITGALDATSMGTAWANLTFSTGWANFGGSNGTGQYKKIGDMVYLRGLVARTSGTETVIATLPSGFRPPAAYYFPCASDSGYGRIHITSAGQIIYGAGGLTWFSLNIPPFSVL